MKKFISFLFIYFSPKNTFLRNLSKQVFIRLNFESPKPFGLELIILVQRRSFKISLNVMSPIQLWHGAIKYLPKILVINRFKINYACTVFANQFDVVYHLAPMFYFLILFSVALLESWNLEVFHRFIFHNLRLVKLYCYSG